MGKWTTHQFDDFLSVAPKPGVYAIYFDDRLVYIGQSNNVRTRICSHSIRYGYGKTLHWGQRFDAGESCYIKVSYSRRYGDWAMRELRLIKRLRPEANQVNVGNSRRAKAA